MQSTISNPQSAVPSLLGYRMPAEWEPHAATWLAWPHNRESWPEAFEPIPGVWAELVRTLAAVEEVHVLAGGAEVMSEAHRLVGHLPRVKLHDIATNDAWTRDHGPTFLVGRPGLPPALVHWGYNAWGGKYPPFDHDQQVPRLVAESLGYQRYEPGIVLEGGAIDTNGQGSLLTTEQCLLNPNRNPDLSRADIERYLADYLAARRVIWLGEGIAGDDTDGHIDELARFVAARVVVAAVEEDPADANYAALQDNLRRLRSATDAEGRSLEVVPVLMPRPLFHGDQRLPASYMNFYVANGLVVAPQYGDPADGLVLDTLGRLFPTRRIAGQRAVDLAWGLGAFHCITQQQPEYVIVPAVQLVGP
ncbi:MAG TPA: agmatine deiminase family protein [Pirellulales bacterium]|nr:agmatine deiminase family protein [Pirellulales bacterium]